MDDNFELFGTQDEANAFAKGMRLALDLADFDQLWVGKPELTLAGDWKVNWGYTG